MSSLFPKNPADKTIVEITSGNFYMYNASDNSWNRLPGVSQLGIATELKDGLMSSSDFKKLNELIVPPPQSSVKGELCDVVYNKNQVGLYSLDDFLKIEDTLSTFINSQKTENGWNLHLNTYGINWTLDINKLFNEIEKRGNLRKRAIQGDRGNTGKKGANGQDKLDTGPVGLDGESGLNAPWVGTVIPEAIKFEAIKPNSNRAVVDIRVEENKDTNENYLVVTRANIGNVSASPNKIKPIVSGDSSPWLLGIDIVQSSSQKVIESATCSDRIVCRSTTSSLYYIDMENILDLYEARFYELLNQIKQAKERLATDWLQVMVTMFTQQKAAICCALENCRSRKRNSTDRRYIEQMRVQAAQSGHNITLDNKEKVLIDMNTDRNCQEPSTPGAGSVYLGDADDCNDCAALVTVDGISNSGKIDNAIALDLPEGEYIVTVEDCCINNSVLKAKWNGRVNIQFNHKTLTAGANGAIREKEISLPDCGDFEDHEEAKTAYIGLTTQISHAGGRIYIWSTDKYPQDNEGKIILCFRKQECYNFSLGTTSPETDETIFVYKDSISDGNFLGAIVPYLGPIDAATNYGYGAATDPAGPGIQYGCDPQSNQTGLFFYDGSDGLSFFTINGDQTISNNIVSYNYEVINNSQDMQVLVSDDTGELVQSGTINAFDGNWTQNGDGDGGVIGYFDRQDAAPWIFYFDLNNSGSIDTIRICSRDGNDLYVPAPSNVISNAVSVTGNNYYTNPVNATTFNAGDGLKLSINGAVGFGRVLRGPSGDTVYSNRSTFGPDGKRINLSPLDSSTTTQFYLNQFFLSLSTPGNPLSELHHDGPLGLVLRFEYDDNTVEEIMPLTNESFRGASSWGYSDYVAFVDRSQKLVNKHNSLFPNSPICNADAYNNKNGTGGWATSTPSYFYGAPIYNEYCQRFVVTYLRVKKSGRLVLYVNDKNGDTDKNVGQYDVIIDTCPAQNFDSVLNPIPDFTVRSQPLNVSPTTAFCESGESDTASRLVFTKIRDGCTMSWQKIEWYERGWRIGACCGAWVELDGQKWLVVKRSIGVDISCGGGENANEECIALFKNTIGHPAIAWQSIDGDEFFGRPTSGSTTFMYDKDLSQKIIDKLRDNDILNSKGDINSIPIVLFPRV